jgi:hypothetical protein
LHPFSLFVFVCALLFLNQLLVNVYVRALHDGHTLFVTRYLGPGWFDIAIDAPPVRILARALGPRGAAYLAPSILRVQAFLELPFVLYAYLSIARALDRGLYAKLTRPFVIVAASVSFSLAFAYAEILLRNPWTTDDLVLRALACVVVPAWIAWSAPREPGGTEARRPIGLSGLLLFSAGAIGTAGVVLGMYDVTLLYNNAHLRAWGDVLVVGFALGALAHLGAGRVDSLAWRLVAADLSFAPRPSLGMRAAVEALAAFTAIFFVPSLPVRYAGGSLAAGVVGLALVGIGAIVGAARAIVDARPRGAELAAAALGALAGLALALVAAVTDLGGAAAMRDPMPEHFLLRKAGLVLVVGIVAWRAVEAALLAAWRAATALVTSAAPRRP